MWPKTPVPPRRRAGEGGRPVHLLLRRLPGVTAAIRRRVVVHGRVQGVWFRESCRREAEALGVAGWVRNRDDGTVEGAFTAKGELTRTQTLWFSAALGALGSVVLWVWVNPLTMWLTFATFVGYAVIYTVILKPLTPQNIVIGGASGAMPPVLGWAAMRNEVGPEALILCLIIFLWTPPHFWALALYRTEDYRKSGLPMLPVTHGSEFTRLQVLLYTLVLFASTLLPFVQGMSGWVYLISAVVLGARFIELAFKLWRQYSDALARQTFKFSIWHLSLLFAALLVDHYTLPWQPTL